MENGQSLGPVSEGTEVMEGASAAVGKHQKPHPHFIYSSHCGFWMFCLYFLLGPLECSMLFEGACLQDQAQKSNQAPPTKKIHVYAAESNESTLSRPPVLHKQPPALPPKPFTRLPNHITGLFCSMLGVQHLYIY